MSCATYTAVPTRCVENAWDTQQIAVESAVMPDSASGALLNHLILLVSWRICSRTKALLSAGNLALAFGKQNLQLCVQSHGAAEA